MNFIDICAGIGGFRVGLEQCGHNCVGFCEKDTFATASYTAMHCATDEQLKYLEDNVAKNKRCKEILKEEYRNGEWYANDIDQLKDAPKADIWCFGFPCFVEGTLILTKRGYIPIEKVTTEDEVLTHLGRWKKVIKTMQREDAQIWEVDGVGILPTQTTDEHPWYVVDAKNKVPHWVVTKELEITNDNPMYSTMVLPNENKQNKHSESWWWLVGKWLRSGKLVAKKGKLYGNVVINVNTNIEDGKDLEKHLRVEGYKYHTEKFDFDTEYHIEQSSFYKELLDFYTEDNEQVIPWYVLELPKVKAKAFYEGFISEDYKNDFSIKSPSIALSLCAIRYRLGMNSATISRINVFDSCRHYYVSEGIENVKKRVNKGDKAYECRKITKAECTDNYRRVFNISVADDESYIANGAIVHNCQDVSVAGKQKGLAGARSGLFYGIIEQIKSKKEEDRPKVLFIENVKNLISINDGWDFARILITLDEAGYDAEWQVCNSKYFGVPHNRERIFLVCYLRGYSGRKVFPLQRESGENVREYAIDNSVKQVGNLVQHQVARKNPNRGRVYDPEGVSPCLTCMEGGGLVPHIRILGSTKGDFQTSFGQRDLVYDSEGCMGCITATDYKQPKQVGIKINPDEIDKLSDKSFIDLAYNAGINMTDEARCIQARYNKGMSKFKGELSGVGIKIPKDDERVYGLYTNDSPEFNAGLLADASRTLKAGNHDASVAIPISEKDAEVYGVYTAVSKEFQSGLSPNTSRTLKASNHDAGVAIPVITPERIHKRQNGPRCKSDGEAMFTLTAQDRHGVMVNVNGVQAYAVWYEKLGCYIAIRTLTPRECFRLQGFSDEYFDKAALVNSNSQLYKQAGNAVTVNVISAIGKNIGFEGLNKGDENAEEYKIS